MGLSNKKGVFSVASKSVEGCLYLRESRDGRGEKGDLRATPWLYRTCKKYAKCKDAKRGIESKRASHFSRDSKEKGTKNTASQTNKAWSGTTYPNMKH